MIAGIFHRGSGVGNQLHRYVATRVLALDKGYDFTMIAPDLCKVGGFMDLDMGLPNSFSYSIGEPSGKVSLNSYMEVVNDGRLKRGSAWEETRNYYNPEFNFIPDGWIIDGEFQDERYFGHRLGEINEWLKVEPIDMPDDLCVIGFRGGEFYVYPELGLKKSYFDKGIQYMKKINPDMKFEVHTDDPVLAKQFFPDFKITHDVGVNWRSVRYAKHAIIANSSFYILPRLLSKGVTIAPRYWARPNQDVWDFAEWSMPQNYYKCFTYL